MANLNRTWLPILFAVVFASSESAAEDILAKHVVADDNIIKCNWARDRFVTIISGPCENFERPKAIRLGERFSANGKAHTIKFIGATRIEKDFPQAKLKKGDVYCVAAESASEVPSASSKDHVGVWLYINRCKVIE